MRGSPPLHRPMTYPQVTGTITVHTRHRRAGAAGHGSGSTPTRRYMMIPVVPDTT